MIFKQHEDGSCDIEFSNEEIKILLKNKKLHLSNKFFKDFGNILVAMVVKWNEKFDENLNKKNTNINGEIKPE